MNYLLFSMATIYITEGQHYFLQQELIIPNRRGQQGMAE